MKRREFLKAAAGVSAMLATGTMLASESVPTFRATITNSLECFVYDSRQFYVPIEDCLIHVDNALAPDFQAIHNAGGLVNSRLVRIINSKTDEVLYCHPETLLFTGANITRDLNRWDLDFKLSRKSVKAIDQDLPGGWNHYWYPHRKGYCRLARGVGSQVFPVGNIMKAIRQ